MEGPVLPHDQGLSMRFMSINSKNGPNVSKGCFERKFGSKKEERLVHSSDKILLALYFQG